MFKNEGGRGVKGSLNNVKKTDDLVRDCFPKSSPLPKKISTLLTPPWTMLKKSDDLVLGVVPYRSFVNLCRICFWWVSAVDDKIFDSGVPTQSKYWTQEGYTWAEMRNWWRRKTKTSHLSPLSVAQSGTGQAFSMALCPHTPYTCVAPNNNTKVLYCDILWMQYIASFGNIAMSWYYIQ